MLKEQLKEWIEAYLKDTDYELITLNVSAGNDILVEVDRLAGVDVDFCAELNRYLVEKLDQTPIVSVDEETFSVDCEEKVAVEGKKRKETQIVTHTWRYEEPKYVKYDLRF